MIMVGASAYPRVIDFARIAEVAQRVGAPMVVDMAHIAGLVAGGRASRARCRTPTSSPPRRTRRCAARARGMVLCREQYAKDLDRTVFPGVQGGPLMHIIAAKAVCFKEAATPEFAAYQRQVVANARRLAEQPRGRRLPARQRRHRQSPDARGRVLEGRDRQGGRGRARQGRHHRQQERHPVRSEPADGGERHPHRHAGGDDTRHARGRDGS